MENFSSTQTSNIVAIAGVLSLVLAQFKIVIGSEEISTLLGAVLSVCGICYNWYLRYKRGDLTLGGFRKKL